MISKFIVNQGVKLTACLLCFFTLGCTTVIFTNSKGKHGKSAHAPGQLKKEYGDKDAKQYAPGQKKKKK